MQLTSGLGLPGLRLANSKTPHIIVNQRRNHAVHVYMLACTKVARELETAAAAVIVTVSLCDSTLCYLDVLPLYAPS